MGPIPDVEYGYELDWNKLKPGGVKLPEEAALSTNI